LSQTGNQTGQVIVAFGNVLTNTVEIHVTLISCSTPTESNSIYLCQRLDFPDSLGFCATLFSVYLSAAKLHIFHGFSSGLGTHPAKHLGHLDTQSPSLRGCKRSSYARQQHSHLLEKYPGNAFLICLAHAIAEEYM
jgi:hypothetical protein